MNTPHNSKLKSNLSAQAPSLQSNSGNTRPTVAIFTGPEGHLSIAQAIARKLEKKYKIAVFEDRDAIFNLYVPLYQFFPSATVIPYKILSAAVKREKTQKAIQTIFHYRYKEKVESFLDTHRPDICISTYFVYNYNLTSMQRMSRTPFFNVIPDPRSINPLLITPDATLNVTFDTKSSETIQSIFPSTQAKNTGWFVRPEFEKHIDSKKNDTTLKANARKKLGLQTDLFTVLIASGSEGTNMVLKLLPILFSVNTNTQIIVACGSNNKLLTLVNSFATLLKQMKKPSTVVALPFTNEIHEYMQASDIVVGKAGPNTIFESVASKRPFFATTHIAGGESGNLDLIREHNIGYVQENALKAQRLLKKIIENPSMLDVFTPSLHDLAKTNAQSCQKLDTLIQAHLNH